MLAKTSIRTALAAVAIAAGTFTAASTVGSSEAEARRIVIRVGHFHHHRHPLYRPIYVARFAGGPGPCYWLRERAEATGRPYWWRRYEVCRGLY